MTQGKPFKKSVLKTILVVKNGGGESMSGFHVPNIGNEALAFLELEAITTNRNLITFFEDGFVDLSAIDINTIGTL